MTPRIVRRKPPPIQIAAKPRWTALNVAYRFDDAQKTIATTRNAAAMRAVGRSDRRWSANVVAAELSMRASLPRCEDAHLGRLRELLHDLDDVAVRVPDPKLRVGAVAAGQDLRAPLELQVGAELAGVRFEVAQRPPHELRDRDPVAPSGRQV